MDEDLEGRAVRTLMLSAEVSPSRLTTKEVVAAAKQSSRRWRWATAAVAVTVVAVAVAAVPYLVGDRRSPDVQPDFAASASAVSRGAVAPPGGGLTCQFTAFPRIDPNDHGGVFDVDATGEFVVGASRGGGALTLWKQQLPTDITIEGRQSTLSAVAVNSAGAIAGYDQTAPTNNWIHRDGVTIGLPHPAGYVSSSVRGMNERGDALGWLYGNVGLVIWPARAPDQPQVIAEAGLEPLAIRGDGTVIAFREAQPAIVIFRPDGTTLVQRAPDGVRAGMTSFVRGDMFYTGFETIPQDASAMPATHPVRWNLKTGSVEIFTGINGAVTAGTTAGWMVIRGWNSVTSVIAPDGKITNRQVRGEVKWISTGGKNMIGSGDQEAGIWRCG
jgi:hypothetical protein